MSSSSVPQNQAFLPPPSSPFIFFSLGISMCPVSAALLCLSPPLLSLSLRLPSLDLGAVWTSPAPSGPVCVARACLICCMSKLFLMLYSHCCITYICILHISFGVAVFVFSVSLSFFTRPTLSRMVSPCEPGPAQGFFLLTGRFPCNCASLGVLALGF